MCPRIRGLRHDRLRGMDAMGMQELVAAASGGSTNGDATSRAPAARDTGAEQRRLSELRELAILDTEPQAPFDALTALATEIFGVPMSLVSLVDEERQWFKSRVGVSVSQTPRVWSFCSRAIEQDDLFEIPDAAEDPRFRLNPLVLGDPRIRFYAGVPLRTPGGCKVGTLCILDRKPRRLEPPQRQSLARLAGLAAHLLQTHRAAWQLDAARRHAQKIAALNAMLARAGQAAATAANETHLLQQACANAVDSTGVACACVVRPARGARLRVVASDHAADQPQRASLLDDPLLRVHVERAWRRRESSALCLRGLASGAPAGQAASALVLPILRGAASWAVLCLSLSPADAADRAVRELLEEFAMVVGRGLERLERSRQEHRLMTLQSTLLDNALAGIVVVKRRRIVSANASFARMLGLDDPQDLLGKPASTIYASEAEFHRIGGLYSTLFRHGHASAMDVRLARSDGEEFICDISGGVATQGKSRLAVWTVQDVTARARLQAQLRFESLHDPLSLLPNRRALDEHLPQALARADRAGSVVGVGIIDLDDFKPVNDRYGHEAGDNLLRAFALRLRHQLRTSDFLARLGGDEFVIVVEGLAADRSARQLRKILQRLHGAVQTPFALGGDLATSVGMSLGLALSPYHGADLDTLLRQADAALYQVKARKAVREHWWQIGVTASDEPREPLNPDPYAPAARQLLGECAPVLGQVVERFVGEFYASTQRDPETAGVLDALSSCGVDRLQELHAEHLRALFAPDMGAEAASRRSARAGLVHALVGVEPWHLIQPSGEFRRLAAEVLSTSHLPARARQEVLRVVEDRLQTDLREQARALAHTRQAYFAALGAPLAAGATTTRWADALRDLIDPIAGLPGILACCVTRPDAQSRFQVEGAAGTCGAEIAALLREPPYTVHLDPGRPTSGGLSALAWRSREIHATANYSRDPRLGLWHQPISRIGVHSLMAVPILDGLGKPCFVVVLFGAYPNQFSSLWVRQFALALQQRASRVWQICRAAATDPVLPQALAHAYRDRLFSGGLEMHVQPIVDLRDGSCRKVEALARLRTEDGALISPGVFLPTLGDAELDQLFRLGLEHACRQMRAWRDAGLLIDVSLNLPPSTLLDPQCPGWIAEVLREHGIEPARVTLELLENQDVDRVAQGAALRGLKRLGVALAMDDLGSGYSSLQRLSSLPFDTVKVDRSLTLQLRSAPLETLSLVRAVIQLARDLRRLVVVEGVEDLGAIEAAWLLGAQLVQGYGIARPMPMAEFAGWRAKFRLPVDRGAIQTHLGALAALRFADPANHGNSPGSGQVEAFLAASRAPAADPDAADSRPAAGPLASDLDRSRWVGWLVAQIRQPQT